MALVIVSGLASSGRSTRSQLIKEDLEERLKLTPSSSAINRVVIVSDNDIHASRSVYASQRTEKPARASYLSAVTRALGRDTIVIADGGAGLNIKGFRYQLWCAAREVGVRCLSVHVHAPAAVCRYWNGKRRQLEGETASYKDENLDSLLMRYEEPNAMTRWDSPLIIVPTILQQDKDAIRDEDILIEPIPHQDIWDAATKGSVNKAPEVVAPTRSTTSNYLSLLESSTQAVVQSILEYQTSFGLQPGTDIPIKNAALQGPSQLIFTVPSDKVLTLSSLQRVRRQFVRMHSAGTANVNQLGTSARSEGVQFSMAPSPATLAAPVSENASTEWSIAKRFLAFLEGTL